MGPSSFRSRLAVTMAIVALLPLVAAGVGARWLLEETLSNQVTAAQGALSEAVRADLEGARRQRLRWLEELASELSGGWPTTAAMAQAVAVARRRAPYVDALIVLDGSGTESLRMGLDSDEASGSGPAALAAALKGARALLGGGSTPHARVLDAADSDSSWAGARIPGLASGTPAGVVLGRFMTDASDLEDALHAVQLPESAWASVLDSRGAVVAHRGSRPASFQGLQPTQLHAGSHRLSLPGEVQREDLIRLAPLDRGWVLVGQTRASILAPRDRLDRQLALLALLAVVMVLGASSVVAERVATPVARLTDGLIKLESGVLTAHAGLEGTDEIARAGRAMDALAATLRRRAMVRDALQELRSGREDA